MCLSSSRKLGRISPNFRLRNADLIRVKLVAKTKHGRGTATLVVGQQQSNAIMVDGIPQDFHRNQRYTYDRVFIDNPSWDSMGKWQIHLRGNFKIKRVVVVVERGWNPQPQPMPQFSWVFQSTINPPFGFYTTTTIPVNGQTKKIKLMSNYGKSKISNVKIRFGNGSMQRMTGLEGSINYSEVKEINIPGNRYVQEIEITHSSRVFFKPGQFEVHTLTK